MSADQVVFGFKGRRYPVSFPRKHLRLGSVVYVLEAAQGEASFLRSPTAGAEPYCVSWIAPSEWYVSLEGLYVVRPDVAAPVVRAVQPHLCEDATLKALNIAAADMRLAHRYKTSEYEKSKLSVALTVADRLDLYTRLQHAEVKKKLWHHAGPLSVYLLLTCFDRLGQPADWITFDKWLTASRAVKERDAILNTLGPECSHLDATKALNTGYNEKYGVRSSFFRFLRDVLPAEQRKLLLRSIEIWTLTLPPNLSEPSLGGDEENERYLFKLRNEYTHKSQMRVSVFGGEFLPPGLDIDPSQLWQQQEQTIEATEWVSVRTQRWPHVLEDSVRIGLAAYLGNILGTRQGEEVLFTTLTTQNRESFSK
jgi:hypothetical protein